MKRTIGIIICAAAGLAGLAGGYALRLGTRPGSGTDRIEQQSAVEDRGDGAGLPRKTAPRATSLALRVKSNADRSKGSHHWLHWMSGVEGAALSDLPGLARIANDNPGALRMIAYRWVELDPKNFFEILARESRIFDAGGEGSLPVRDLARYLFEEWPKHDAEAAAEALSSSDALVGVGGLRHSVVNTVFKRDPKLGFELMAKWNIHNFGPDVQGVVEWAGRDPVAAAQAALAHPVGYGARRGMEAIGKEWARNDPEGAMAFAAEATGQLSRELRESVLAEWAKRDLEAASDWLAGQGDEDLERRLSPVIVEAWAKDDPQGALAWCEQNLEGHHLLTAVAKLAKGAAANDPQVAAELVSAMEPSPVREQAAVAVAESWFPQSWPSNQTIAAEAIAWLRGLDDPVVQGKVIDKVGWGWSTQDRDGLMEFLMTEDAARASDSAYHSAMRSLAREDPQRALAWAAELPAERVAAVSRTAYSVWLQHQPGAAVEWLMEIPAADGRRPHLMSSYFSDTLWRDESIGTRRLSELPSSDHQRAREEIARAGIPEEKKAKLLEALGE